MKKGRSDFLASWAGWFKQQCYSKFWNAQPHFVSCSVLGRKGIVEHLMVLNSAKISITFCSKIAISMEG